MKFSDKFLRQQISFHFQQEEINLDIGLVMYAFLDCLTAFQIHLTYNSCKLGMRTLGNLYNELNSMANKQLQEDLPKTFSYFDCTDCVENKNGGFENGKGVLTLARRGRPKKMKPYDHFMLLILYLILPRKYDVHGGYFRSKFLSKLIYRLACIGYKSTEEAYDGKLHLECQQRQIRALLKS